MDFLGIGKAISGAVDSVSGLIDGLTTTDEERLEKKVQIETIKLELTKLKFEANSKLLEAQSSIVLAEVQGELWIQKAWRPLLMLTIIAIIANNYVIYPYISTFGGTATVLELPTGLWTLLTVGLGGYVGGRTLEKIKGV